ncbi:hypothetical protein [Saccharopolyspora spinosa]|uniref:hypothetical protein n=1 Tax=Saccharopolyspora spinosa TaxID=60894 RepID=UPI0037482D90
MQISTRGTTREITTEKKGTYHVYRAGKAIYTLTDRTEHRFLFSALPGKLSEVEVTIDNGGYFAVESTQAAAKNLPGPPPAPAPPASAPPTHTPLPAPATLPEVWTPHTDDEDAAALLPRIRGHLVIGLTASGGTLTVVPELATRIEQLPGWARRPVVLIGSEGSLDLSDAAQLRDTLGVDVITADQEVWHTTDGRVVTGDLSFVRGGLPTWSERIDAMLGGHARSATAGHWHLFSATGGNRLPGADLVTALAGSGTRAQPGTAPRSDFRWGARSAPVTLAIHGTTDTADYTTWTRSPYHAAALPEGRKPCWYSATTTPSPPHRHRHPPQRYRRGRAGTREPGPGPEMDAAPGGWKPPRPVQPPPTSPAPHDHNHCCSPDPAIPPPRSSRPHSRHPTCQAPRSSACTSHPTAAPCYPTAATSHPKPSPTKSAKTAATSQDKPSHCWDAPRTDDQNQAI